MKPACVDFETLPIRDRPRHPPVPVGVAIKVPGRKAKYLAWGHPGGGNTCCWSDARRELGELWESGRDLLFHNAKFDVPVAEVHMGMPRLPWTRYHDTQPQLFIKDPRAPSFSLKPSAHNILGWKPEERDAVEDWLLQNQPIAGVRLSPSRDSDNYVGAYIAYAPVFLVGPYAVGDVDRTDALDEHVRPELAKRDMLDAYDRERRLLPVLMDMEEQGVRVAVDDLERDAHLYEAAIDRIDTWVRRKLKTPGLDVDSGQELVRALLATGLADEAGLGRTEPTKNFPEGQVQSSKEAIAAGVKDPQLVAILKYRAQTCTCLRTFIRPWLEVATQNGGLIYTNWNSTRVDKGRGLVGTRTGRLSSTPNFQNIPKEFDPLFFHEQTTEDRKVKKLPRAPFELPPLPRVRAYIVPFRKGEILIDRDYSQQEPRILAHFEDKALKAAYLANPWTDYHDDAKQRLDAMLHRDMKRKIVKGFNLGLMYGMGIGLLAAKAGIPVTEAKIIKDAILAIYPGLKEMYQDMRARAREGRPIRTWGGREYFCEPPKLVNGEMRSFDYKLVNVLIQGSAADCTKEAMIRLYEQKAKSVTVLLTVHDEILASCPESETTEHMEVMRKCMESVEFDVPMLSEGTVGENAADLQNYDKKGKLVWKEAA